MDMSRFLAALSVLALAGATILGCGTQSDQSAPAAPAAKKASKSTFICHMGADCGKADVAAGENVPSCCGKVMVKADTFSCACGKTKIIEAGKPAPECCGASMKKAALP
jgi:hypothetical protein